jgi:hypothetical protein
MVVFAATAQAQTSCGATNAVTATCSPAGAQVTTTVQKIVRLTVNPASAALTAPTDVTFAASGVGTVVDAGLHVLTVRANVNWAVTITGSAWTGSGNNAKAIGDLEWTINGGTSYTTTTNAAVSLTTGAATASAVTTVGYRTTWNLVSDGPGTYTMGLTFTISST